MEEQLSFEFISGQTYGEYHTDKLMRKWACENGYNDLIHRPDIIQGMISKDNEDKQEDTKNE